MKDRSVVEVANPAMLVLVRDAVGWSQAAVAEALHRAGGTRVTQGWVSRTETGALPVSGERLARYAQALGVDAEVLTVDAPVWPLGTGCRYPHQTGGTLRQVRARLNLTLLAVTFLADGLDTPLTPPTQSGLPALSTLSAASGPADGAGRAAAAAEEVREQLGVPDGPVPSMIGWLERAGALVVRSRGGGHLGGPGGGRRGRDARPGGGSGVASVHPADAAPLFTLDSGSRTDWQRLALAHELGHAVLSPTHILDRPPGEPLDYPTDPDPGPVADPEVGADAFADELLMPARLLGPELAAELLDLSRLRRLKAHWRVPAAALARRARDLDVLTDRGYRTLLGQMSRLGWQHTEPDPLPAEVPIVVPRLVAAAVTRYGGVEIAAGIAGLDRVLFTDLLGTDLPDDGDPR